jgi:hypothetical protein
MRFYRFHLLLPAFVLASCIGTKTALHTSSSTFGVDIDSTPPTTDIGLARTELSVQPAFAQGKTPSSLMGFSAKTGQAGFLKRFFFGTSSVFSTGQAAANLAGDTVVNQATNDDSVEVDLAGATDAQGNEVVEPERPHFLSILFGERRRKPFKEDEMFPLITGTKTNYGLNIEWDASTQMPRAVKAGFNRKELSYAPVIGNRAGVNEDSSRRKYKVKLPSVLAAHQMETEVGEVKAQDQEAPVPGSVKFDYVQYLATGQAAELLAKDGKVRAVLRRQLSESQAESKPVEDGKTPPAPVQPR